MAAQRRNLKGYEGANLLFFLLFIAGLVAFVALIFRFYGGPAGGSVPSTAPRGVLSEAVVGGTDTCIFYLGTRLSGTNRRYRGAMDIPVTDDGLVKDLLEIPGVVEVVVNQTVIMLQKAPSARWEAIQHSTREVIDQHLHMHP